MGCFFKQPRRPTPQRPNQIACAIKTAIFNLRQQTKIKRMKNQLLFFFLLFNTISLSAQELYTAPAPTTQTRWLSPENPKGEKGRAAATNKGAKGAAFVNLLAGESLVMMDVKGAGIVNWMWISGTIPRSEEQRRMIKIEMYWDGAAKPAVSVPIGDFFGVELLLCHQSLP